MCCVSLTSVHEWQKRFCEGHTSLQDDSHTGQAHGAITPNVIVQIDGLIWENQQLAEEEINVQVGISHGSMHTIVKDHLQFQKICVQWVPHQLTEKIIDRMAACLSHLQQYHKEEYMFLSHITGDKMWCHHFEPESNQQSQQWKHLHSALPKKTKAVRRVPLKSCDILLRLQGPFAYRLTNEWSHSQCKVLCRHVAETAMYHKIKTPWKAV